MGFLRADILIPTVPSTIYLSTDGTRAVLHDLQFSNNPFLHRTTSWCSPSSSETSCSLPFLLSLLPSAWLPLAERRFEHQVEWRFLCPQVSLCFWCDYIRNILSQWCHTEAGVDGGSTVCHTKQDQKHQKLNCSRQPPQWWTLGARLWRHPSVSRIRSYPLAVRRILSNHKENNKRNKSKCRLMLFLLHTHSNLQPCNLTSVFFTHSRTQAK